MGSTPPVNQAAMSPGVPVYKRSGVDDPSRGPCVWSLPFMCPISSPLHHKRALLPGGPTWCLARSEL
jgi:hypothetical protein